MSVTLTRRYFPLLITMILLAAASRLLPHWPNFGPVGAMALFGAATFQRRWMAFVVPFAALYLSDLALNNLFYAEYYNGFYWGFSSWVYVGFLLTILLGFGLLRNRDFSWLRIGGATVSGTLVFFLLTNFGVWLGSSIYPQSGSGLLAAYAAGLPFLLNSAAGNVFFAGLLFGGARYLAADPMGAGARERA
ncbi:hypothetical protein CLV84_4069 [Neolewinella xylanilytica]|uniref:Uncharacterized protein n=1 Tax=Neolewinella xylanilytica TaxID=1514080 RepID=A0A2S6I0C6_9BACT|nr:DUF6580 family putative transport protein [Neolewinella xylanilytica]PPK84300.1 hypothetical protein CLV84_4069 [Neolewinella xylanilytica]